MSKKEDRAFLKELYYREIEPKLDQVRRANEGRFPSSFDLLNDMCRAMRVIRFLDDQVSMQTQQGNRIITTEIQDETISTIERGVERTRMLLGDSRVVEVIQEYYEEIVDSMEIDDFPQEDIDVIRKSGSSHPRREVGTIIHRTRVHKERLLSEGQEVRFAQRLGQIPQILSRYRRNFRDAHRIVQRPEEPQPLKPKIIKGVGGICQGVLLAVTDTVLVTGIWAIPVSVDAKTVGAVYSIAAGIGALIQGAGDLRGE